MAKKATATAKTAKAKKPRILKHPKAPFKVMLGRVSKDGKKYKFDPKDKHLLNTRAEAQKLVNEALGEGSDDIREILVVINPEVEAIKLNA